MTEADGPDLQAYDLRNRTLSVIFNNNSVPTDLSVDAFDRVVYWINDNSLESQWELLKTNYRGETQFIRSYNRSHSQISVIQGENYYYVLSFHYHRVYKYDKRTNALHSVLLTKRSPDKMTIVPGMY